MSNKQSLEELKMALAIAKEFGSVPSLKEIDTKDSKILNTIKRLILKSLTEKQIKSICGKHAGKRYITIQTEINKMDMKNDVKFPFMYKGYVINEHEVEELVGGPYENNEKREYRKTGEYHYSVEGAPKGKKAIDERGFKFVSEAKNAVDKINDTKRNNALLKKHKRISEKFQEAGRELFALENEMDSRNLKFINYVTGWSPKGIR